MEVTRVENMDTHFVHGTSETIAMSMTADSSLLHVLSDALYSDKEFAVCREYIANGWDAHSMNGNSNPIQVTTDFDEEEIIFRDYGPGIAHENMGPIFGTYGASTKRDDKNQIGGFGLGSKAGYSVSETFTVISYHKGVKTIYVASKGSEETNGFYDLQVVARTPTDETGMEIRISVDRIQRFADITKQLANFGHKPIMLRKVSGGEETHTLLEPMAPEVSESGMLFAFNVAPYTTTRSYIFIRLGGICYPLNEKDEYSNVYSKLESIAKKSRSNLIIEAPAGEIPLSPSREALSYSPTCIQTIKRLLDEKSLNIPNQEGKVRMVINRAARRAFGMMMTNDPTFLSYLDVKGLFRNEVYDAANLEVTDYLLESLGNEYTSQIQQKESFVFTDLQKLTTHLAFSNFAINAIEHVETKVRKRILAQPRLNNKALFKFVFSNKARRLHHISYRKYFKPIYKLYHKVFGKDVLKNIQYVDDHKYKTGTPFKNLHYISNNEFLCRIALYYRQSDLALYANKSENLDHLPALAHRLTKKDDVHGIVNYLKAQGFSVIDLVTDEEYKNPPKTKAQIDAQGRPKTSGYQLLSDSLDETGRIAAKKIATLNRQKTNEPDLVLLRESVKSSPHISGIPIYKNLRPLLKHYPNAVIVSSLSTANNVSKKKGIPSLADLRVEFSNNIVQQLPQFYRERHKLISWRIHNSYANSSLGKICGLKPMKKPKLKLGDVHEKFEDFINLGIFYNSLIHYKECKYLSELDNQIHKKILLNHKAYRILNTLSESLDKSFFELFENSSGKPDLHAAIKKLYEENIK